MSDERAVQEFQRHEGLVYGWALRVLAQADDARDVVQDVSLRWLLECRRTPPASAVGWLRRVTLNRAIDHRRRASHSSALLAAESVPCASSAVPAIEADEVRRQILEALAALSDMQRQVLIAKHWDDHTFAEIADELGIAIPTAKTHYVRGLAALRERLQDLA
jgi:RNA polymerase sigma-70 factor (ECF subfamily)